MPATYLFEVKFPRSARFNGGELGTEASMFTAPAAITTFIYVAWFLNKQRRTGDC